MQKSTPEPQVVPSHTGSVQLLQSKSWPHVAVPSCTLPQQVESNHVGSSSGMLLRRYETLFKPVCVAALRLVLGQQQLDSGYQQQQLGSSVVFQLLGRE